MTSNDAPGIYGKLPAHGDFISRNLPSAFINIFDEWLQGFIAASQEQLTDNWLDIYLTSPIWRFVLSRGCVDGNAWAGIMIPSVDKVGRYFPFCVVTKLQANNNLVDMLSSQASWFKEIEDIALNALDGETDADTLFEKVQEVSLQPQMDNYQRNDTPNSDEYAIKQENLALVMDFEEQLPSSTNSMLLDWLITRQFPSYSLWHSTGSNRVQPSFLVSPGLPALAGSAALLEGNWQKWQWNMPFQLVNDVFEQEDSLVF